MAFPSSIDVFPTILSDTHQDDSGFEADVLLNRAFDAIEQLEAKVGVGATTPAGLPGVLRSAAGGSEWATVKTGDIAANAITIRPAIATGTTDPTTTNTTTAALANPTISITIPSGMTADIYVEVRGTYNDGTGAGGSIVGYALRIDGGGWQGIGDAAAPNTIRMGIAGFHVFQGITAGVHTIEIGNSSNTSNSITHYGAARRLRALGIAK